MNCNPQYSDSRGSNFGLHQGGEARQLRDRENTRSTDLAVLYFGLCLNLKGVVTAPLCIRIIFPDQDPPTTRELL
jgi:hypothetical protein